MKMFSNLAKVALAALLIVTTSCSNDDDTPNVVPQKTIAELAQGNADLSSLVAALTRADLVATVNGTTEYTVFAPTNAAFDAFLTANGFANLDAVPVPLLKNVLLNHVLAGEAKAAQVTTGYTTSLATNDDGDNLSMYLVAENGGVTINGGATNGGAAVTTADVDAKNGVVHVVDAVIGLPKITTFALSNPALSNLVAALGRADSQMGVDLTGALANDTVYTAFAPTDDAFAALLTELGVSALTDIAPATVEAVLKIHVVAGNIRSTDLADGDVTTLGGTITIDATNLTITDPNSRVTNIVAALANIQAMNGVVHVVDKVIRP